MEQAPRAKKKDLREYIDNVLEERQTAYNVEVDKNKQGYHDEGPLVEELSNEAIDKHNEEIRARKREEQKEEEKEFVSNFGNEENKKSFNNLNNGIKGKFIEFFKGIKFEFFDRSLLVDNIFSDAELNRDINKKQDKLQFKTNQIEDAKLEINKFNERLENIKKQFGNIDKKAQKEADKEKKKLENNLNKLELEKSKLNSNIIKILEKKDNLVKRKDELLEKSQKFIESKIESYQKEIENLNSEKKELGLKLEEIYENIAKNEEKINSFEEVLENINFKFEKKFYKEKTSEIKKAVREQSDTVEPMENNYIYILIKTKRLEKKVDYWSGIKDEINQTNGYFQKIPEENQEDSQEEKNQETETNSDTEEVKEKNTETVETVKKAENAVDGGEENQEQKEDLENTEVDFDDYIRDWNMLFGTKLKLNEGMLSDITEMKKIKEKNIHNIPIKDIEDAVKESIKKQNILVSNDSLKEKFMFMRKREREEILKK